jgi:hypothetical protein
MINSQNIAQQYRLIVQYTCVEFMGADLYLLNTPA